VDGLADESVTDSSTWGHEHHIWDVEKVKSVIADQRSAISFFCGGSRNFPRFIDLFDEVFVLDVDLDTLSRRLARRPADEFGRRPSERDLIVRLHTTKEDVPKNAVRRIKVPSKLGARQALARLFPPDKVGRAATKTACCKRFERLAVRFNI
jgi:hypothetical protein